MTDTLKIEHQNSSIEFSNKKKLSIEIETECLNCMSYKDLIFELTEEQVVQLIYFLKSSLSNDN